MNDHPSITKFATFVQLKDFHGPTKKEYVRYVRKCGEHFQCDPLTLTEDQLRGYFLFLRQEKCYGGSAMKLARCALRAFFRDCHRLAGWTVFEVPLVLARDNSTEILRRDQRSAIERRSLDQRRPARHGDRRNVHRDQC